MNRTITAILYISFCVIVSCMRANAATYLECKSKDIKTCSKEVSKGEVIMAKVKNPKSVFIKIDFMKFDTDKGTLKVDKE